MKRFTNVDKKSWSRDATIIRLPQNYPWKVLRQLCDDIRQSITPDEYELAVSISEQQNLRAYQELKDLWGLQLSNASEDLITVDRIRCRYQFASLLSKYQDFGNDDDKKESAKKTFFKAELLNRQFNMSGYRNISKGTDVNRNMVFIYARAWIEKVIGQTLPGFEELTLTGRHGPGASTNTINGNTHAYFKYAEWPYDCTRRCIPHAIAAIQQDQRWLGALEDDYRKVHKIEPHEILNQDIFWKRILFPKEGNRIAFVPKSYKTHRTIAIEPTMNLYLQLGVDGYIRKRLKRWGFNLDDQTKNQELARLGSLNGRYATLDLSMASDTVSTRLCRELLPEDWFHYLMDLRSPYGDLDGRKIIYEKISSMGNGYTFALESLIFASLVYGTSRVLEGGFNKDEFCVYGDDIIVPVNHVDLLVAALKTAGFTVNTDKSFFNGFIRESCGTDWFKGKAIRPVFIKTTPKDLKQLFSDHNRMRRWFNLRLSNDDSQTVKLLHRWIPSKFKTFVGPISDTEFDTYIHCRYPLSRFDFGEWKFSRLVRQSRKLKDSKYSFHFRKLLARLTPMDNIDNNTYDYRRLYLDGDGFSQFDVPISNNWYFAVQISSSDLWSDEYAELPGKAVR